MMISITAFGEVAEGRALTRAGGRPGDRLYVSGTVGDAGAGLAILEGRLNAAGEDADFLVSRYQAPEPRTGLGPALIGIARAAIDVSDGLLADLGHICDASGCGAELELEAIPRSDESRNCASLDPLEAMWAGDDYELLFAVPDDRVAEAEAAARDCGLPITAIGRLTEDRNVRVRDSRGREIDAARRGFSHF